MIDSVSIIVAVYNGASFIHQTVDSILNQSFKDIEIILVDDNSKDDSPEIIKKYELIDSRVHSICLPKNSGNPLIPARIGCKYASSEWVIGVGHDDVLDSNYVLRLVERQNEKSADVVLSQMVLFTADGKRIYSLPNDGFDFSKVISGKEAFSMTVGGWQLSINGMMVKKAVFGKTPEFMRIKRTYMNLDEFVGQYVLYRSEKVAFSDARYNYRVLESSITHKLSVKLFERLYVDALLEKFIDHEYSINSDFASRMRRIRFNSLSYWMQEYLLTKKEFTINQRCKIINMLFINYSSQNKRKLFDDFVEHSMLWKISHFTLFVFFYLTFNSKASRCLKSVGAIFGKVTA